MFLMREGMRGGVEASEGVEASLLPVSDFTPPSSSCSLGMLAEGLMQKLRQVVYNSGAIARDEGLNLILPNRLADLLGIKLLEL